MSQANLAGRLAQCGYHNKGRPHKPFRNYGPIYGGGHCDNRFGEGHGCRCLVPSRESLPFFKFRGVGSYDAETMCAHCSFHQDAHDPEKTKLNTATKTTVVEQGKCPGFAPHGAYEYDAFYCGCFGWD